MTMNRDHVHVVATLQAHPDHVAELTAVLAELAHASRNQRGNLRFDVHQQSSDPTRLITIEQWDSVASVDAHMTSEPVGAALGKLGPLLAAPPQIVRYSQLA